MSGKIIGLAILGVLGLVLFGWAAQVVLFPAHVINNEIQTAHDVVDKTINADNAIYNYEWFKQQKEDIDASRIKLLNARESLSSFEKSAGDRKDWTFEDKGEWGRLNSVVLGLQNHLEQQIADYNAKAKMANRTIFQDGILPNVIDATTFIFKN